MKEGKAMTPCMSRLGAAVLIGLLLVVSSFVPVQAQGDGPDDVQAGEYNAEIVQVDTSKFPQVSVYVSVTDAQGNPVGTLPPSAFTLLENGEPVDIGEVYQAGEQGPVTTVLSIDHSGSMNENNKIEAARQAAIAFVDLMRAEDRTGIISFNTQVTVAQPLTSDKETLRQAIAGIRAFQDTALYDALAASVGMLNGVEGRKAIILLSDGLDNRSQQQFQDIVDDLSSAEISVYTIGLGDPALIGTNAGIDEARLREIAEQSRGQYLHAPDPDDLGPLYQQISSRLQNEYRITYTTSSPLRNGVARGIEVRIGETTAAGAGYNPGGLVPETAETLSWPVFGVLMVVLGLLLFVPEVLRRTRRSPGAARPAKGRIRLTDPGMGKQVDPMASKQVDPQAGKKSRVRMRNKDA